jgi:hypothetical protein
MKKLIYCGIITLLLTACGDALDSLDVLLDEPSRKTIDTSKMGVNAFFNQQGMGTISEQGEEIKDTLRLKHVRILIPWIDQTQACRTCDLDLGLSDNILKNLPEGLDALVVLTNVPSWTGRGKTGRKQFASTFVNQVTKHYSNHPKIVGWQIWNEPNNVSFAENEKLDVLHNPENYVEMVAHASQIIRDNSPGHLILNGATTGIAQNWPSTLKYNKKMRDAGIEEFIDIYAIHYYGTNYVNTTRPDGNIRDFVGKLKRKIWVTESGEGGINNQLEYVERTWPFIRKEFKTIDRIYYYRFLETARPAAETEALRNIEAGLELSDLYIYLRDR